MRARLAPILIAAPAVLLLALGALSPTGGASASAARPAEGCLACHTGIEDMHPAAELTCTDCHGGDPAARTKGTAHVRAPSRGTGDESVAPRDADLAWRRFKNPMDLRVARVTCGDCHADLVERLETSLHATTAGHLSDGYYEMGLVDQPGSRYAVFPVQCADPDRKLLAFEQPPPFRGREGDRDLKTHFTDLVRKECMQCHLWSEGRAVRGRVGFDGDYRGAGCAACHVAYAIDGLSTSADPTVPKMEPGHPLHHAMQRAPTTETCTTCHYGDASIGLAFRGLSQLPPGAPGGPDIPGTTDRPLNRAFYIDDPTLVPPDVHHEKGMHCVDCHTLSDVMGDGRLHGQMEHAVEISCQACHGTFEHRSDLRTERGTPLTHLRVEGDRVILTSKVDGRDHDVPQVVDVLDPSHERYNPDAEKAMMPHHADLECYACHAAWNVNFLGFHFSRNASLTQLDLLSGKRTPGRVTTQEKVFATWKSFYAGRNEAGRIAPYMTGFSTMGSVWDEEGELVLDQAMPVTADGLSGMTMVHHQTHTTRPTARACVECHRSSTTWGLGSLNHRLARQLAFVADRRGIEVVALDRGQIAQSPPLGKIVLPDVVDLAAHCDPLQGRAHHVYATEGGRGVHVIDVSDPAAPRRVAFVATINPRALHLAGDHLYLADGVGGLRIFDVSTPERILEVGRVATFDAYGVHVQWPYAYVADGPGGLAIVDVRAPIAPRVTSSFDLDLGDPRPNQAIDVKTLFQNSRPLADGESGDPSDERTPARHVAVVLDRERGVYCVDVTEATHPRILFPSEGFLRSQRTSAERGGGQSAVIHRGIVVLSHVDLADAQGGEPTRERDYVYVMAEGRQPNGTRRSKLLVYDFTNPKRVRPVPAQTEPGRATEMLAAAQIYNQPFLQTYLFSAGEQGVLVADYSTTYRPKPAGALIGLADAYAIAFEEFPLDRMVDEMGRPLKAVSRRPSRWLNRGEIERILDVPGKVLGTLVPDEPPHDSLGASARLFLERFDRDGSGLLHGDEVAQANAGALDVDGDGRVSLIELADVAGLLRPPGTASEGPEDPAFLVTRVDRDGDLARLFDGLDPHAFDKNGDDRLDRREAERALFAALDLDGDGRLSLDELSRHPGDLRRLRYRDEESRALYKGVDRNGDGAVTPRELALSDAEWEALDADGDGAVQLRSTVLANRRGLRSSAAPEVEWPERREYAYPLPPTITRESFDAAFDLDGDGTITKREMKARSDLFRLLDLDGSGVLTEDEVAPVLDRIGRQGVDATIDSFLGRWDLDGDGRVEPSEIPNAAVLGARAILLPAPARRR